MDWLRRILAILFGGRSDDLDDDRRSAGTARDGAVRDDAMAMNESGSPDDRDEADDDRDTDASSGGDDGDSGGDDGGGDDD